MPNLITKLTPAIDYLVDSYRENGIINIEYTIKYNEKYDYYTIFPTFYIGHDYVPFFRSAHLSHELAQKIQDYLGIKVNGSSGKIVFMGED